MTRFLPVAMLALTSTLPVFYAVLAADSVLLGATAQAVLFGTVGAALWAWWLWTLREFRADLRRQREDMPWTAEERAHLKGRAAFPETQTRGRR